MYHRLSGMFTALVTPFAGEAVDFASLERLIARQIGQGADGIVLATATGECAALSSAERQELLVVARKAAARSFPIIAAVGNYATAQTLAEIAAAERAGVSALLLRMPYYSRPTQAGLVAHAKAAAASTGLDIILDNDPDRCGVELSLEALEALDGCANIIGILERRGDLVRCDRIARIRDRRFLRLTGAADTIPAYLLSGGCGAVTGIGNLAPHWLCRLAGAVRSDFYEQAQLLQRRLVPLLDLLAREPEPVLIKQALAILQPGFGPACRLPLTPAQAAHAERLAEAIEDFPQCHLPAAAVPREPGCRAGPSIGRAERGSVRRH